VAVPRATYRLQLTPDFGFDDAAAIAGYLAALGVSHVYCSPYLQAAPGSTHGYDVVDHSRVNTELGGEAGCDRFCQALLREGLGQVLDVVPNHMAISGRGNRWWWDVLENGPSSQYASYFDVDWDPPEAKLRHIVLMPILGDHYGRVLEAGDLRLEREGGSFVVRYRDHLLPVAPRSLDALVGDAARACGSDELESIATALGRLPLSTAIDRASVRERHRDKEVLRARVAQLCEEQPQVAKALDVAVADLNADPDAVDALLDRQNYRLSHWRTAAHDLDYRRFFDIPSLVALRMEDEGVFADTHELALTWISEGRAQGIRVDHVDGLSDPGGYVARLAMSAPGAWIVVEKILEHGEQLPGTWPVAGTTGYDFLNHVIRLFIDPAGRPDLDALHRDVSGDSRPFADVAYDSKHQLMTETLAADVSRVTECLARVCERHRLYRDYTRPELQEAVRELVACFPVYRSYARPATGDVAVADLHHLGATLTETARRRPGLDHQLLDFVRDLLLLRFRGEAESEFVVRFQQLTGPVMAKGVEDTAFYSFTRFVALNEVGGDPDRFALTPNEFHQWCAATDASSPDTMLTTSTHDTKRSEDVRARLALLSEIPGQWSSAVRRWRSMNERRRRDGWPDGAMELLLYQTLVGAHPLSSERALGYIEKAAREAKVHTSWVDPNREYERALIDFVRGVLADPSFTEDLERFVAPLIEPGRMISLAQTLLKLTAPGVPDLYQGSEVWDLSLVDPDNRRPVDYGTRRRLLKELDMLNCDTAWRDHQEDGLPKLLTIVRSLQARAALGRLTGYAALSARGWGADHVVAFAREPGLITVVPRLVMRLRRRGGWRDTTITVPSGRWRNVFNDETFDGGEVDVAHLLAPFPVSLLSRW
jgi:(1->4)-alpha-D-glucan 1-alpha-D-glucosylmutase